MIEEFRGDCICCRFYFGDLYLHYATSENCFKYLTEHKKRIDKVVAYINTLEKPPPKEEKVLDIYLDRIVLTYHGYWCRRRDVPEEAKIIAESEYFQYPNPIPEWMTQEAKKYSEVKNDN